MPISFSRFAGTISRVAFAACCAMTTAHADVMYDAAWVECDQAQDRLTIRYGAASSKDPGKTVFWSLIDYTRRPEGDPDHVSALRSARHSCRLSTGLFEVVLQPKPMNHNLQGLCGAIVRGSATVLRDGQIIMPEREFETGECAGPTRRIDAMTVHGKGGAILVDLAKETD
jgi:hypothetical protein